MSARRTRIKGIANIPQRRKTNTVNEDSIKSEKKDENGSLNLNPSSVSPSRVNEITGNDQPKNIQDEPENVIKNSSHEALNIATEIVKTEVKTNPKTPKLDSTESVNPAVITQLPNAKTLRRKFIRPAVSNKAINKLKQNVIESLEDNNIGKKEEATTIDVKNVYRTESEVSIKKTLNENKNDKKIIIIDSITLPPNKPIQTNKNSNFKSFTNPKSILQLNCGNEVTLNETHLSSEKGIILKPEVPVDRGVKRWLGPFVNPNHNSDNEYPPPPPSPSKINRSRIKAIPRLGYRKTSFSASESEDESRKHSNRIRNDSVCSTASTAPDNISECMSPQRPPKEVISIIQKKCNRTEQSRKLAEARREFQRRFGSNKPDRQRLTMMDLIFYNPTTNPMHEEEKQIQNLKENTEEEIIIEANEVDEGEKIDDPIQENENTSKSDEENEMPVPQIKIGPSGEIIIDEKSLVIENKDIEKQKKDLQKAQLVNGDFDTGYGIYKRKKRAKDWTQSETLRFYKALNSIGTDFTLMCDLFPKRNRRELKMKFKKEEKVNQNLVDKAVMQPTNFDFAELKHEAEMEEKELEEIQRQKEEERAMKIELFEERKRKATMKYEDVKAAKKLKTITPQPPKLKISKPKKVKINIESILENSDADESDIATQSESENEEVVSLKPTRSGRVPKVTKKFSSEELKIGENENKMDPKENLKETDPKEIEEGSIMVFSKKGTNGELVHQLYMVTPNKGSDKLGTGEILLNDTVNARNILTISESTDDEGDVTVPEENNVTIPAEKVVGHLKSIKDVAVLDDGNSNLNLQLETKSLTCL